MSDLLIWLAAILILGGAIAGPGGHLWEETAKVLHFFGKEITRILDSR
jgi:hypothetical protein